jgi:four helix bundle protein
VEEETDETRFWLEIIKEMQISTSLSINYLLKESDEIISIVVSSIKTVRKQL